ncbi:hypothetical protein QTP88_018124 [Uroleucon formosanum]
MPHCAIVRYAVTFSSEEQSESDPRALRILFYNCFVRSKMLNVVLNVQRLHWQERKKHSNIYLSTNSSLNTDPSSIAHHLGKYFEKNSSNEIYSYDFLWKNKNIPSPQPSVISP